MQSNSGEKVEDKRSVKVIKNGSYLVVGPISLFPMTIACDGKGTPIKWAIGDKFTTPQSYLLCRCGQSGKKPFCDSSHVKVKFDGTEANQNETFEKMAQEIDGPEMKLYDAESLCASARFCHRGGDIWDVIHRTDMPEAKKNVVENSSDCPSGRLVAYDKETGVRIEPVLDKSIGTIEDPAIGTSGPLWVRGGIPVYSADGQLYEARNRVTLCRCGKSQNKPFCDSSHYPEEDREQR
ncbi:MAG TPA: CDGSH iron-sulfur domain-containing protein [Candidatus Bathyarchaeia archaeon]|nr:CDGSH iron-sulfur domain-containing protein [Candidatus Bathyarchaeia archaeon]